MLGLVTGSENLKKNIKMPCAYFQNFSLSPMRLQARHYGSNRLMI